VTLETEALFLEFIERCSLCGLFIDVPRALITEAGEIICKDCQALTSDETQTSRGFTLIGGR
jgi:hypothetical protein